jgi:hypothetical protein
VFEGAGGFVAAIGSGSGELLEEFVELLFAPGATVVFELLKAAACLSKEEGASYASGAVGIEMDEAYTGLFVRESRAFFGSCAQDLLERFGVLNIALVVAVGAVGSADERRNYFAELLFSALSKGLEFGELVAIHLLD